jgi:predicted HAD superfamily hydrolase
MQTSGEANEFSTIFSGLINVWHTLYAHMNKKIKKKINVWHIVETH